MLLRWFVFGLRCVDGFGLCCGVAVVLLLVGFVFVSVDKVAFVLLCLFYKWWLGVAFALGCYVVYVGLVTDLI